MAKYIKEIARKLADGSYENVRLGVINISELSNDSNFITNTVDNLSNYYTKTEVYTQAEINELLNAVTTLDIQTITEFPENPSTTTIYLKGDAASLGNNKFEEWIYTSNTGWELIGSTYVDLNNYYTKTEIDNLLVVLTDPQPYEEIN